MLRHRNPGNQSPSRNSTQSHWSTNARSNNHGLDDSKAPSVLPALSTHQGFFLASAFDQAPNGEAEAADQQELEHKPSSKLDMINNMLNPHFKKYKVAQTLQKSGKRKEFQFSGKS